MAFHFLCLSYFAFTALSARFDPMHRRQVAAPDYNAYIASIKTALYVLDTINIGNETSSCLDVNLVTNLDAQGYDGAYAAQLLCEAAENFNIFPDADEASTELNAVLDALTAAQSGSVYPNQSQLCATFDVNLLDNIALNAIEIQSVICSGLDSPYSPSNTTIILSGTSVSLNPTGVANWTITSTATVSVSITQSSLSLESSTGPSTATANGSTVGISGQGYPTWNNVTSWTATAPSTSAALNASSISPCLSTAVSNPPGSTTSAVVVSGISTIWANSFANSTRCSSSTSTTTTTCTRTVTSDITKTITLSVTKSCPSEVLATCTSKHELPWYEPPPPYHHKPSHTHTIESSASSSSSSKFRAYSRPPT